MNRNSFNFATLAILLCLTLPASASGKAEKGKPASKIERMDIEKMDKLERELTKKAENKAPAPAVTRESWARQYKQYFGKAFCKENRMTNECYSEDKKSCLQAAEMAFNSCAQQTRLPASIPIGNESVVYGQKIGRCLGAKIHNQFKPRASRAQKCRDAYAWL